MSAGRPITLVTGGAGFIGGHLVEALVAAGDRVRVLDDLSTGRERNLAAVASQVDLHEGDIRDAAALDAAMADVGDVFHLAAVASVPRCSEDPLGTHDVNVTGTLQVLEAARAVGARRVVFTSSCAVYGDVGDEPAEESRAPAPQTPYALHKLAGELYSAQYTRLRGLETACLRLFNVYGPRQDPGSAYAAVVPRFAAACLAGEAPSVHGDGEQTRDLVMIDDVIRAFLRAREVPGIVGNVCNVGTGRRTSVNELLSTLLGITKAAVLPKHSAPREGDLRDSVAAITRARDTLDFEAVVPLAQGLRRTVDAMAEKGTTL